jgi:hypothetical protein
MATVFKLPLLTSAFNENPPHCLCGCREEMTASLPLLI